MDELEDIVQLQERVFYHLSDTSLQQLAELIGGGSFAALGEHE
jgi:hypothetical protein